LYVAGAAFVAAPGFWFFCYGAFYVISMFLCQWHVFYRQGKQHLLFPNGKTENRA
jgi:hypothetical protein